MAATSTQTGYTPTESLLESNNDKDIDTDQLLMTEIVIISQQPLIQSNTTNMIPSQIPSISNWLQTTSRHMTENENLTSGQLGRRLRRRRQRQRRQQRRQQQRQEEQLHQERQRRQLQQQRERRRQHRSQRQRALQQQQQQEETPQQLTTQPRYRRWSSLRREHEYWDEMGFPEFIEENLSSVLETYYWETMHPNERQEIWEQNHLNELVKNSTFDQQNSSDNLEVFAVLEHLILLQDKIEQIHQISSVEELEAEQLQERHDAAQIQLQRSEQNYYEEYVIQQQNELTNEETQQSQEMKIHQRR